MRRTIPIGDVQVDPDYLALNTSPPLVQCIEVGGWRPCGLTLFFLDAEGVATPQSDAKVEVDLLTVRSGMPVTVNGGGPYELADRVDVLASAVAPGSLFVRVRSFEAEDFPVDASALVIEVQQLPIEAAIQMALEQVGGGTEELLSALNTGTSTLSRIKSSAAAAITDAALAEAGTLNGVVSTLSHIIDNILTALNTGTSTLSRIKSSAAAAITENWGTLLEATASSSGGPDLLLAAPPGGQKHEVMSYYVSASESSASGDQFAFTNASASEPSDFYTPFQALAYGGNAHDHALAPTRPLFTVTAGALYLKVLEGLVTYNASITYRTVPA